MDDILTILKQSLEDDFLSKPERKSLSQALENLSIDANQITLLRSKVFELSNEKITDKNYRFILEWIKDATNVLSYYPQVKSKSGDSYFSPGDDCRNAIVQYLNNAKKQLKICVFTISDDTITEAIIRAHKRGVGVMVLTDNDKSFDLGSDIEQISKAGIAVKMDQTSNHMHHKFMIVDNDAVVTGSYNWTRSAARFNHENVVIMKEEAIVKSFITEFDTLWSVMSDY
jgi:mitochondrial cardiolipin hydrolase